MWEKLSMTVSRKFKCLSVLILAVSAVGGLVYLWNWSQEAHAKPPVGKTWAKSERVSMDQIDHTLFDKLLQKYVDSDGYVDYSGWQKNKTDRAALKAYLAELGRADLELPASREGKLAFWINAYNALTIEGILQVYPTTSIRNHTARLAGYNIWKHLPLIVGGKKYSLDDIEHKILRPMGEPRIHFAIVCASVGCPKLRNEVYTAKKLEGQLTDNARDFFQRAKHLRVDSETGTITLSLILKWFGSDFGGNQSELLATIRPYLPKDGQRLVDRGVRVQFFSEYDWRLNDQKSKPAWDRL